jgi:hypothetical protein
VTDIQKEVIDEAQGLADSIAQVANENDAQSMEMSRRLAATLDDFKAPSPVFLTALIETLAKEILIATDHVHVTAAGREDGRKAVSVATMTNATMLLLTGVMHRFVGGSTQPVYNNPNRKTVN